MLYFNDARLPRCVTGGMRYRDTVDVVSLAVRALYVVGVWREVVKRDRGRARVLIEVWFAPKSRVRDVVVRDQ